MLPRTNNTMLTEQQANFVSQCKGNKECSYVSLCKNADVSNCCSLFHQIILKKLKMDEFPEGTKIPYYAEIAFGKRN